MPTADVDAAQSNVPVYQQSDVVEVRMPGGPALKEREAAINNVDATIAARESNGEEWWSEYRKDYSGFTEMFGVSTITA